MQAGQKLKMSTCVFCFIVFFFLVAADEAMEVSLGGIGSKKNQQ